MAYISSLLTRPFLIQTVEFLFAAISLFSLSIPSSIFEDIWDAIGPTQIIQNNLPILESAD